MRKGVRKRGGRPVVVAFCLGLNAVAAGAQGYPVRPVRLLVPFAVGGGIDTTARGIAGQLTEGLKQTVVVENRTGGGGVIAVETVAKASPDGYTLLIASSTLLTYTLLYPANYDPFRDFSPITQVISLPLFLTSARSLPAANVGDLIALARKAPGTINYASAGVGGLPHLTGELFKMMTGTNLVHVPYKGGASPLTDLLSGQIQLAITALVSTMPLIKAGKLRGLAVTSRTRARAYPEFPTLDESGVPGFDVTQWYGLLAPAGTPSIVLDRLRRETADALRRPDFIARLAADGSEPVGSSREQFTSYMRSELKKWRNVIAKAGIRAD